ncbi:MAG: hypothetical protein ABR608_12460 [Pseudonocardiaceae bacterium]
MFRGGVGFNVQIWRQIGWLLSFVEHWWHQPDAERASALRHPWAFRDIVAVMPTDQPGIRKRAALPRLPRHILPDRQPGPQARNPQCQRAGRPGTGLRFRPGHASGAHG